MLVDGAERRLEAFHHEESFAASQRDILGNAVAAVEECVVGNDGDFVVQAQNGIGAAVSLEILADNLDSLRAAQIGQGIDKFGFSARFLHHRQVSYQTVFGGIVWVEDGTFRNPNISDARGPSANIKPSACLTA